MLWEVLFSCYRFHVLLTLPERCPYFLFKYAISRIRNEYGLEKLHMDSFYAVPVLLSGT